MAGGLSPWEKLISPVRTSSSDISSDNCKTAIYHSRSVYGRIVMRICFFASVYMLKIKNEEDKLSALCQQTVPEVS